MKHTTSLRLPLIALSAGLGILLLFWMIRAPKRVEDRGSLPPNPEPTVDRSVSPAEPPLSPSAFPERKRELLGMDPAEAVAWILRELESGTDQSTGQDLAIGRDQNLSSWPSYRVFLIDLLFQVDPDAAARLSRDLVDAGGSPDEWAVALRNVAKAEEGAATLGWLREKSSELLRNEAWREDPSAGYLNAFDVIVHTGHTGLAPELLELCDKPDQRAVRHASFLVIDRLTQRKPGELLPLLAEAAGRQANNRPMISNLMARADPRDPVQRAALERYLLDPNRTADELERFAGVFPNANFHVSNNLLTGVDGIEGGELSKRDAAALETVERWLAEPSFEKLRPQLEQMRTRLERFVGQ
jgi:hypothetical protein